MRAFRHLRDHELLHALTELVARERAGTAELVACIAEVDARRLYVPTGYPSMYAYCVGELGLSEDAAYKRIQAARATRRFPILLGAVADGRLHLSGLVLLTPHLTQSNAQELLEAAAHKTKSEIEQVLARRFPRPDVPTVLRALPDSAGLPSVSGLAGAGLCGAAEASPDHGPVPGAVTSTPATAPRPGSPVASGAQFSTGYSPQLAPGQVDGATLRPRLKPLAPSRFALQVTIGRATHEKLRHAQALLGHRIPSGDLAAVLDMALDSLIGRLEKRKFAATGKPRPRLRRSIPDPRHVPAHVKRAVWKRDGGQCTFVGEKGHRCNATRLLEYDHIEPVARGGEATVANIRLRCRAHNQHEAERAFGAGFMAARRQSARDSRDAGIRSPKNLRTPGPGTTSALPAKSGSG